MNIAPSRAPRGFYKTISAVLGIQGRLLLDSQLLRYGLLLLLSLTSGRNSESDPQLLMAWGTTAPKTLGRAAAPEVALRSILVPEYPISSTSVPGATVPDQNSTLFRFPFGVRRKQTNGLDQCIHLFLSWDGLISLLILTDDDAA